MQVVALATLLVETTAISNMTRQINSRLGPSLQSYKILFIPASVFKSHYAILQPLISTLAERGHNVSKCADSWCYKVSKNFSKIK
jgi:phage-related protein